MVHIRLQDVTLKFKFRRAKRITLKEYLLGRFYRSFLTQKSVTALKEINLEYHEGERIGIIGHNGAGKSSMLRLMAGVYSPTSGRRSVAGRISSLFEIAFGFETEANGWENIAYRGYLQGETPQSIRAKRDEIAEFCELGDFLNMPIRYYSSGMLVRLAFAIATAIEPEILLVDETLSVGDLAFQQKARRRMEDMMSRARLIVMVSHDLATLASSCTGGIWLDHGTVMKSGPITEVIEAYTGHVRRLQGIPDPPAAPPPPPSCRFTEVPPGCYDIQVSWHASPERSPVVYQIHDGVTQRAAVNINQQAEPVGHVVNDKCYQSLGCFFVQSGSLRLVIQGQGNLDAGVARLVRTSVQVSDDWQPPSAPLQPESSGTPRTAA